MLLLQLQHEIDAADIIISDEAEATRLVCPLILQDHTVLDIAEVQEIVFERAQL